MNKTKHICWIFAAMFAAATISLSASSASAAVVAGDYLGKTKAEITKTLKEKGYKVLEVLKDDDEWEMEASIDKVVYEIKSDVKSGKVLEIEKD